MPLSPNGELSAGHGDQPMGFREAFGFAVASCMERLTANNPPPGEFDYDQVDIGIVSSAPPLIITPDLIRAARDMQAVLLDGETGSVRAAHDRDRVEALSREAEAGERERARFHTSKWSSLFFMVKEPEIIELRVR